MFLTKDAVRLAVPGHAEGVACDGCPPLERLFEPFSGGGGELLVCPICVKARELDRGLRRQRSPRRSHADVGGAQR
jgi:predicted peroxiredoxin